MNKTIYISEEEVDVLLDSLNQSKERLKEMIDKQKEIDNNMHKAWGGTSGDKAYETIKKHEKKYTLYLDALNIRIIFLEKVKKAYFSLDKKLDEIIDNNNKIEM